MTETSDKQTFTVGDGDDLITYDVRGDLADATPDRPALFLLGAPMEASYFGPLAAEFGDRRVITYDPRGTDRNPKGTTPIATEQRAADIHRVIDAVGGGPVDVFASSGGAVDILCLVANHPDDVRRVVAHEPPAIADLPDCDAVLAAVADIVSTYEASGDGPAMAKFVALVMHDGELDSDYAERPAPDPDTFGMSADDDGRRENPLIRNMAGDTLGYRPDYELLRGLGEGRLVLAVGAESGETMAARCGRSVADRLGQPAVEMPSHHGGFVADQGDPVAFAESLRAVLG